MTVRYRASAKDDCPAFVGAPVYGLLFRPRRTRLKPSCVSSRACLLLVCPAGGLNLPRVLQTDRRLRQRHTETTLAYIQRQPVHEARWPEMRVSRTRNDHGECSPASSKSREPRSKRGRVDERTEVLAGSQGGLAALGGPCAFRGRPPLQSWETATVPSPPPPHESAADTPVLHLSSRSSQLWESETARALDTC